MLLLEKYYQNCQACFGLSKCKWVKQSLFCTCIHCKIRESWLWVKVTFWETYIRSREKYFYQTNQHASICTMSCSWYEYLSLSGAFKFVTLILLWSHGWLKIAYMHLTIDKHVRVSLRVFSWDLGVQMTHLNNIWPRLCHTLRLYR